tara:strand:+ start:944 stop:1171 length:228 start_codon:yes stop_codon:yes gene_type:complete
MIENYIFANKNRFKITGETEEHYLVEFYKENQIVDEFYIPKQDNPDMIRNALLFWYSSRFLIKTSSNTTLKEKKS